LKGGGPPSHWFKKVLFRSGVGGVSEKNEPMGRSLWDNVGPEKKGGLWSTPAKSRSAPSPRLKKNALSGVEKILMGGGQKWGKKGKRIVGIPQIQKNFKVLGKRKKGNRGGDQLWQEPGKVHHALLK